MPLTRSCGTMIRNISAATRRIIVPGFSFDAVRRYIYNSLSLLPIFQSPYTPIYISVYIYTLSETLSDKFVIRKICPKFTGWKQDTSRVKWRGGGFLRGRRRYMFSLQPRDRAYRFFKYFFSPFCRDLTL